MDAATIGRLLAFGVASLLDAALVPIPVELFVVSAVLIDPANTYAYPVACVVGSLIGAPIGHRLGRRGEGKLAQRKWFVEKRERVQAALQRYGVWGVAACSATPFPYPLVTITSGLFGLRLVPFLIAVAAGRSVKFFGTAYLVRTFGEHVFHEMKREALIALVLIAAVTFVVVEMHKRFRARANKASS